MGATVIRHVFSSQLYVLARASLGLRTNGQTSALLQVGNNKAVNWVPRHKRTLIWVLELVKLIHTCTIDEV